ncbi:hypothetical protein Drorol1_Dr00015235, partial [Drosera rotundifolia]
VSSLSESKNRSHVCNVVLAASLILGLYFIGGVLVENDYKERVYKWHLQFIDTLSYRKSDAHVAVLPASPDPCKALCRPVGSESLPEGIITKTSDLEMRPLWNSSVQQKKYMQSKNLLAITVGIRQRDIVKKIVEKFLSCAFVVMLFHYDGIVDEWRDLDWNDSVIHLAAKDQTKWWFAKRFLHPDIVAEYDYVFLWDEDLDVGHFNPLRYINIVKKEGFEISQPAVDPSKSVIHYQITMRQKKSTAHRRVYKSRGCDENSTGPPCTGWVEIMAPAFSRAAWKCVWYMIQNDLIHAWGLDGQLGYCAQGNRTKNVGVVDSEYVVHLGLSILGVGVTDTKQKSSDSKKKVDNRGAVRKQSYNEMQVFRQRWVDATRNDKCWIDMYLM